MGGLVNSIFGGQSYETPEMPEATPAPAYEEAAEPVAKAEREKEKRRIRSRRALSGTILTDSPGAGILGKIGG